MLCIIKKNFKIFCERRIAKKSSSNSSSSSKNFVICSWSIVFCNTSLISLLNCIFDLKKLVVLNYIFFKTLTYHFSNNLLRTFKLPLTLSVTFEKVSNYNLKLMIFTFLKIIVFFFLSFKLWYICV